MTNLIHFKRNEKKKKIQPDWCSKKWTINKHDIHEKTKTTELEAPDMGQTHTECGGVIYKI